MQVPLSAGWKLWLRFANIKYEYVGVSDTSKAPKGQVLLCRLRTYVSDLCITPSHFKVAARHSLLLLSIFRQSMADKYLLNFLDC